jgi:predicted ABC-class ATPase
MYPEPWRCQTNPSRRLLISDAPRRFLRCPVALASRAPQPSLPSSSTDTDSPVCVCVCAQHVVERTSVVVTAETVEARFTVALPAQGRSVLGGWAAQVLVEQLPRFVHVSLPPAPPKPAEVVMSRSSRQY